MSPDGRYRAQREDTSATFVFSLTTEGVARRWGRLATRTVADPDEHRCRPSQAVNWLMDRASVRRITMASSWGSG